MSKVYFNHTTKLEAVKKGLAPAATIALRREGNEFHYGITICSRYDNYNKAQGREIALARLEQGFYKTTIPSDLALIESKIGEKEMCLTFLYQLSASVTMKSRKWRKRITRFNMERNEGAKVVALTSKQNLEK